MKYHKESRCRYCNDWQVYDRKLHHLICPTCTRTPNTYLKQISFQQKQLARKLFEMVRYLTEQDIILLRNNEFENNHHCHHCNRILPSDIDTVIIIPNDSQTNPDPGIGQQRRRRPH